MPKKDIDYNNTVIYKLVHKNDFDNKNIYIGNTTNFRKRKDGHKSACNNPNISHYNLKHYVYIRENDGWDNWSIIELEKYPCNDANEARARERYWIEHYKATLNTQVPSRTKKEWKKDNKESILTQNKEYYENNKEIILKKCKIFREKNKEKIQEYRDDHKEKTKKYNKKYNEENKEKVSEYRKVIIICECGCGITRLHLARHKKSKKHSDLLKILAENTANPKVNLQ